MPSRVVREGILTSERVNRLTDAQEVFYRRVMSVVDDFGRFHAHAMLLWAACYPLRLDKFDPQALASTLEACKAAGVLELYEVEGKPYLQLIDFRQQVKSKSKFPEPPSRPNSTGAVETASRGHRQEKASGEPSSGDLNTELPRPVHDPCTDRALSRSRSRSRISNSESESESGPPVAAIRAVDNPAAVDNSTPKGIGSRLPEGIPNAEQQAWAATERPDLDIRHVAAKFRDHWLAMPGDKGLRASWDATWRNFVRREFASSATAAASASVPAEFAGWERSDLRTRALARHLGLGEGPPGGTDDQLRDRIRIALAKHHGRNAA